MKSEFENINLALIKLFSSNYVPAYIKLYHQITFIKRLSPYTLYTLLGPILFIPYIIMKHYSLTKNDDLLAISICAAIISSSGVLLVNGYNKVVDTLFLFPRLFTERKQYKLLLKNLFIIFKSPYQYVVSIVFGVLGFLIVLFLDPAYNEPIKQYLFFLAFCSFFIAGFGLWLAISTIIWIYSLQYYGTLNLFQIPGKTLALISLSKLLGIFSLSFSLVVGLFLVALFSIPWNNVLTYKLTIYFLGLPFIIFTLVTFILPQYYIKNIVHKKKVELIINLEEYLKNINYIELIKNENSQHLQVYSQSLALHDDLISSPSFPVHVNTLIKFAISVTIPTVIFIFQRFIIDLIHL